MPAGMVNEQQGLAREKSMAPVVEAGKQCGSERAPAAASKQPGSEKVMNVMLSELAKVSEAPGSETVTSVVLAAAEANDQCASKMATNMTLFGESAKASEVPGNGIMKNVMPWALAKLRVVHESKGVMHGVLAEVNNQCGSERVTNMAPFGESAKASVVPGDGMAKNTTPQAPAKVSVVPGSKVAMSEVLVEANNQHGSKRAMNATLLAKVNEVRRSKGAMTAGLVEANEQHRSERAMNTTLSELVMVNKVSGHKAAMNVTLLANANKVCGSGLEMSWGHLSGWHTNKTR
ncbi:hypothetical protein CONPUDRAFT_77056 [Coniophora puteana RWD-64-598 SS2]|uniref:Uncharacterized protein n=1 Tax=Coniophora puteana (strain RWD-64-598) TaxID=741705 RepID=A0A5M3MA91_CONPW|nr:uncharacterized protein CONPUDRAFT_77056 [Coniophora puteana RWD-64-598 SS2]EIW76043.1 hypothetical protein CONPUDRAFT_77056 [Coniophora puteana RWD-64-598 SS2]